MSLERIASIANRMQTIEVVSEDDSDWVIEEEETTVFEDSTPSSSSVSLRSNDSNYRTPNEHRTQSESPDTFTDTQADGSPSIKALPKIKIDSPSQTDVSLLDFQNAADHHKGKGDCEEFKPRSTRNASSESRPTTRGQKWHHGARAKQASLASRLTGRTSTQYFKNRKNIGYSSGRYASHDGQGNFSGANRRDQTSNFHYNDSLFDPRPLHQQYRSFDRENRESACGDFHPLSEYPVRHEALPYADKPSSRTNGGYRQSSHTSKGRRQSYGFDFQDEPERSYRSNDRPSSRYQSESNSHSVRHATTYHPDDTKRNQGTRVRGKTYSRSIRRVSSERTNNRSIQTRQSGYENMKSNTRRPRDKQRSPRRRDRSRTAGKQDSKEQIITSPHQLKLRETGIFHGERGEPAHPTRDHKIDILIIGDAAIKKLSSSVRDKGATCCSYVFPNADAKEMIYSVGDIVKQHLPRFTVIHFGMEDIERNTYTLDIAASLISLGREACKAHPATQVIISGISTRLDDRKFNRRIHEVNADVMNSCCSYKGLHYLDNSSINRRFMKRDGIYLNSSGINVLASRLANYCWSLVRL